jgi:hypothetical protein
MPRRGVFSDVQRLRARQVRVTWMSEPHSPATARLLHDALLASPVTCLLRPRLAPDGWSPLLSAALLRDRALVRAVCYAWATDPEWIATGARVMRGLLDTLAPDRRATASTHPRPATAALPGAVPPTSPEAVGAVVGALAHLHAVKVLEFDARLGTALGSRDRAVQSFLALPLALPSVEGHLGSPLAGIGARTGFEAGLAKRWSEHTDHLGELVSREIVDNLVAMLRPRIVKRPAA